LVHAEMVSGVVCSSCVLDPVDVAETASDSRHPERYRTYLATRPPQMEIDAIGLMIRLATEFGVRMHIVHVAAAGAVDAIASARAAGVPITAETCPHYLTFTADEVPDG